MFLKKYFLVCPPTGKHDKTLTGNNASAAAQVFTEQGVQRRATRIGTSEVYVLMHVGLCMTLCMFIEFSDFCCHPLCFL